METATAPTTEAAAPEAAPQASPEAAPQTSTEATPVASTPDVFGSAPAESASSEQGIINQLYTPEGGLAEGYSDVLRENGMDNLANTVAKYKSADGLLKGAANLISFAGRKVEGVSVPNEGSTEHEVAEYRKAIGVPESPTSYEIQPENMPEGLEWSDEVGGFWQGKFHELGIGQDQAAQIAQAYSDFTGIQLEQAKETLSSNENQHLEGMRDAVKKEWGDNYDRNMEAAVSMATVMNFDFDNADDMAAIRNPKVLNMLLNQHSSLQEGALPKGGEATSNAKGSRDMANELLMKYPNMSAAPTEVQSRYVTLRKLASREQG